MKRITLIITNNKAFLGDIFPEGISLTFAVLGFFKSISLSIYLLKAIADDLAKTIHSMICTSVIRSNSKFAVAKLKPIIAKGNAKMVWLNFIRDK